MTKLTLMDLLDSRENRVHHQQELLEKFGGTLVSMTLNIPGPVKDRPEYRLALREGMRRMKENLAEETISYEEIRELSTGPEGYLSVGLEGFDVKTAAVRVEEEDALGRLFDIDVMTEEGGISRRELGAPPRKCLLCDNDAKVCARGRSHEMNQLLEKIEEILRESGLNKKETNA